MFWHHSQIDEGNEERTQNAREVVPLVVKINKNIDLLKFKISDKSASDDSETGKRPKQIDLNIHFASRMALD